MLIDRFQRTIRYLRLSVTDLCNLRCTYCMPLAGVLKKPRSEILTFEEITRLVGILAALGIERVRLTGGEPLVRKGLPDLVARLKRIPDLREILLTTNGLLLQQQAAALKTAGLTEVNVHLDTLDPEKFRQVTRWGDLAQVLAGLEEARRLGFSPIKINMVVQKDFNDGEIEAMLRFAQENRFILRLIELMPIGPARDLGGRFVSLEEVRDRLSLKYELIPSASRPGKGPAVYYQIPSLGTLLGFISPLSQPFCAACDRIRISSDGRFQDCLAYDGETSLRSQLRDPTVTDDEIARSFRRLLWGKREGHEGFGQQEDRNPCMYGIGG